MYSIQTIRRIQSFFLSIPNSSFIIAMFPSVSPKQSFPDLEYFDAWNEEKKKIHNREIFYRDSNGRQRSKIFFNAGEIWWVTLGKNIGGESYGKWPNFARPVYIFRKFSADSFLALPITSREKIGSWYLPIEFKWLKRTLILPQIRYMSAQRLLEKIADIPEKSWEKMIDQAVKDFLHLT